MPIYSYVGIDPQGQEVIGTITAHSLSVAINHIRSLGCFPMDIHRTEKRGVRRRFMLPSAARRYALRRQAALFIRDLADSVKSGVPLPLSLAMLHDRQKNSLFKTALKDLLDDVQAGRKFSEALQDHLALFDKTCITIVRSGEASGSFENSLGALADYVEKSESFARKNRAGAWKTILGVIIAYEIMAYFSLVTIGGGVIPMLVSLDFSDDEVRWTVLFSTWNLKLVGILLGILFGIKLLFKFRLLKRFSDWLVPKLPYHGKRARNIAAVQFSRSLERLLSCGIPLADAFDIAKDQVGNLTLRGALTKVSENVRQGEPMGPLLEQAHVFPPAANSMIAAAERTDNLAAALRKIADFHENNAEALLKGFQRRLIVTAVSLVLLFVLAGATVTIVQEYIATTSGCGPTG